MKTYMLALVGSMIILSGAVNAADRKVMMPIQAAMASDEAKSKLDSSIRFYFGDAPVSKKATHFGSNRTNKKTNAFNKSDAEACNWVFLSAMLALQKHAKDIGANAVVNIVSNYDKKEFSSTEEFECHAGGLIAGVALKADFVRLEL